MENAVKKRNYTEAFVKRKETQERHKNMNARTYDIKVVNSKLSREQKEHITALFREAKWFRNYCIADAKAADYKVKSVPVKVEEGFEERAFKFLSSQMKQELLTDVKNSLKVLKVLKDKGHRVGKLKFKSFCNSIPLNQNGVTFRIYNDKKRICIQKMKKSLYVLGLNQIPENAEIATANFVRKPDGYHIYITCFEIPKKKSKLDRKVGIDFGISNNLTLSDGKMYNIAVPESKAIKLHSKKMNKSLHRAKKLGVENARESSNHFKRRAKLQKAHLKVVNRRQDLANKIVHEILNYSFVAIQDEMISLWQKGWFGKQIRYSAMGEIKKRLKQSPIVYVVDSSFPSTQMCPNCGCLTKHSLKKRIYQCKHCGYTHSSRDIKSAQSILDEALKHVSMEHRANSLVELTTTTSKELSSLTEQVEAMKQEAQELALGSSHMAYKKKAIESKER